MQRLDDYVHGVRLRFESMLKELVEIPSISADPSRKKDIFRAADAAEKFLRSAGARTQIIKGVGNPVVLGHFETAGAKRSITIYNHLDVQPANEPEWNRDPFVFAKRGDKYFGRGSTDDKGPALAALLAAEYSVEAGIPINIHFIWELEEEIGSPNFEDFLKHNRRKLRCDSVLVIDSVWISRERPCVYYALRGNITGSMKLRTATRDVHSGITGGVAVNPLFELCKIAASCYDPQSGRVLISGFDQDIARPTAVEIRVLRKSGFRLKNWAKSYGLKKLQTRQTQEAIHRLWCRPTFEVIGIQGGYTGPGVKTSISPFAELKFSCRLAPRQNPKRVAGFIRKHVRKMNPDVKVNFFSMMPPYLGPFTGSHARAASRAYTKGFSRRPVFARVGGSDGAIVLLERYLRSPIVLMGLSLPEHGYHAPNEYFDWGQASGGIKTLVHYFREVASLQA